MWKRNRDELLPQGYAPPKTVPQYQSGEQQDRDCAKRALNLKVYRSDMDDKTEKEYIQGVKYETCKTKNTRSYDSHDKRRANFMGKGSVFTNKPKKGRAGKRKTSNSDHMKDVSNGDNKCMNAWHRIDSRTG